MPISGSGGIGHASGCPVLTGATAYVGSDSCKSEYTNYFYTGDYGTHTLLFADAVDYVGGLGGGSISLEAMTYTGILVVDEDEVEVFGQGWDTFINGSTEGHAITVSGDRCVIRDLQCGTTAGGGNNYDGISITGTHNKIENVFINGADRHGIGTSAAAVNSKIFNCRIYDPDGVGIDGNAPQIIVNHNEIKQTGSSGIICWDTADESIVCNNIIDTTGADSIFIHGDALNCVVEGNFLTDWTGEAIDSNTLTTAIGNDNWAGAGTAQTIAGPGWTDPVVTAGGVWAGRMIQVFNTGAAEYRSYVYLNGGWHYAALT